MRAKTNRIPSTAAWAACVGIVFLFAASAQAGEIRTECPLTHPHMPDIRLRSGECMPDGMALWSWRPDQVIDHGDRIYTDIDIYRRNTVDEPLRKAKIVCNYGHYKDKIAVFVPVPGALLRCGIKYRLPKFLGPGPDGKEKVEGEFELFEVWAISETDDKPDPPK